MKKYTKEIAAFVAMAIFTPWASAQTVTNTTSTSHSDSVLALNGLTIGGLPAGIQTVVNDLNGYLTFEQNKNVNLQTDVDDAQLAFDGLQAQAALKVTQINGLIAANPLDPQIAVEQANLALIQADVANAAGLLSDAESSKTNSDTKINLYQQALDVPVANAQTAAANAATDITQAVADYSVPNSSAAGLEGIIGNIDAVVSGDQAPFVTAIENANTTFAGIGADNADVADIQALVGVINTQLPSLPPISAADKDTAMVTVLGGAYERVAIADNASALTTLNGDENVAGSVDSKVKALADGAVQDNADALTTLNGDENVAGSVDSKVKALADGAVQDNADALTTLNGGVGVAGSVANSIDALGLSNAGVAGVIEKSIVDGDEIIKLGSNTFTFNNTTDTISTSSGDLNLDADVAITGDLEVAGDVFVGGRSLGLQSQIDTNREDIDRNARGIAMVAALQHTTVLPGMTQALDLSAAHFEGETGMALNYARRINENVQINFGAASTSDFDESVIKAGIGVQW